MTRAVGPASLVCPVRNPPFSGYFIRFRISNGVCLGHYLSSISVVFSPMNVASPFSPLAVSQPRSENSTTVSAIRRSVFLIIFIGS